MRFVARCLVILGVALAMVSSARAGDEKKTSWKVDGQLEEACSCNAACPCWFGSKPTRMRCSGGMAFFIDKGSYGDVPLDGLAIAFMGQNPPNTTMMESMGNWDFGDVFIDEKANPAQRKALEELARATFPPVATPDKTHFHVAPIGRKVEGAEHVVTLGSFGGFSGHLLSGGMGGSAPKIVNAPGADPFHKDYEQGVTTRQTYTASGQNWDWGNSNYMFDTFSVTSDEFAKYAVAMTQQMEKAKASKKPEKGSN
jgi:hypothetical protein